MREQQAQQQIRRANLPDNQRYTKRPARPAPITDESDDDDLYEYPPLRGSSRRYDVQTDQAYTQRQLPAPREHPSQPQRYHPLVYVGLIILCASALLIISSVVATWWQRTSDSFKYGYPRAYQVDADVGHGDSYHPVSHFVAINNHGVIEVVEIPGDPGKAKPYLYLIAQVSGDNADLIPVTLTFSDVDGDGKVDMQVHVNGTVYVLYNTGTAFKESN